MAQRQTKLLDLEALWSYALRALGGRAHSISELREKLKRRAGRGEDVEEVLGRLKRHGYLDDRRLAESFAASRLGNEGFGRMRVLRELRRKRVAPAVAEKAVQSAYREVDEVALIEAFLERKYRKIPLPAYLAEPRHLAAAYQKLRLAGFSSGNAIRVLKRYAAGAEDLESLEPPEEDAGG
jgi:regulatory protein